jgi:hypothetical protein
LAWAGGIGVGGTAGPGLVLGLLGRLRLRPRLQFERVQVRRRRAVAVRVLVGVGLVALVWFVVLAPLVHDLTRVGGVFRSPPRVLR